MKTRYMALVKIGDGRPAEHVVAPNRDWAMETAATKAQALADRHPGTEVTVDLLSWRAGQWQWLDSRCHLTLEVLPNDYSTPLGAERIN